MNRLRRWAHEGPLRTLLMRPAVRRRIATILALRFLIATCALRSPLTFLRDWLRSDSRRSTYPTRCGATVELAPRADLEAFYEVFWRRDYDPPPTLAPRLRGARVILDLGANVGTFSAFALSRWPNARVVAYEPEPTSAAAYTHWAESTDAPVTLHIAAASTTDGTVEFVTGWGGGSHRAREGESGEAVQSRDVFADLRVCDLAKIDIEGGEWPILADPRLAELQRTIIVMEYHRVGAPGLPAREAAEAQLRAAGFTTGYGSVNYWGHGTVWAWKEGDSTEKLPCPARAR